MSGRCSELKWFCKSCDDMITKQCDKLQEITQLLTTLIAKSEKMESALLEKVDTSVITALESRVAKVEESAALKLLEEKVDKLTHSVHNDVTALHKSLQHEQMKTEEDKDEEREIEVRKNNVIVHGLSESTADSSEQRTDDDLTVLAAMFHEAGVDSARVESVVRLGKRSSDPSSNPRPLKVVLDTTDNKINLLRRAKNLRRQQEGGWEKVFVHQDLTPKQREARKLLVAELKERKAAGETNLMIYNGRIVQNRSLQNR